jgi:hypothetical protein
MTGVSVIMLILVLQSPQGAAASKTALSVVDSAVSTASPYVAEQAQLRATALLQKLREVTREGLTRGNTVSGSEASAADTTT